MTVNYLLENSINQHKLETFTDWNRHIGVVESTVAELNKLNYENPVFICPYDMSVVEIKNDQNVVVGMKEATSVRIAIDIPIENFTINTDVDNAIELSKKIYRYLLGRFEHTQEPVELYSIGVSLEYKNPVTPFIPTVTASIRFFPQEEKKPKGKLDQLTDNIVKILKVNEKYNTINTLSKDVLMEMLEGLNLDKVQVVDTLPEDYMSWYSSIAFSDEMVPLVSEEGISEKLKCMLQTTIDSVADKGHVNIHSFILYYVKEEKCFTLRLHALE